jgi:hypothetical protein
MEIAAFMATTTGRLIRVVAGIVALVVAFTALAGTAAWIVAAIGIVLVAVGAFNVCLIAPLLKAPFNGRDVLDRRARP